MRIALISDVHANMPALDAVLADIAARGVDRVVCLGDIVDLGPEPCETVQRIRDAGIACVRGNHDHLTEPTPLPLLERVKDWTAAQLSDDDRTWLDGLPLELRLDLDGVDLLCVHATPRNDCDQLLSCTPVDDVHAMLQRARFQVLAMGHTHVPMVRRLAHRLLVNVGSVGMPFAAAQLGDSPPTILPWAEYAIVEGCDGMAQVDLRRVAVDISAMNAAVGSSGMPDPANWMRRA